MTLKRLSAERWRAITPGEAAAHWLIMRDSAHWSEADQDAFDDWLAEADANRLAMARAERAWGRFDLAEGHELLDSMRRSAMAVRPDRSLQHLRALAAVVVAAVLIGGLAWWSTAERMVVEPGFTPMPTAQLAKADRDALARRGEADYETVHGQRTDVTLPDGTQVTLNTDSAIDVAFERNRRVVRLLKGEGYFNVAHNPARPFVVEAADRQIIALGTQFDVRLDSSYLRVLLVTGRVHVKQDQMAVDGTKLEPAVNLLPGDRLTVALGMPMSVERKSDAASETSWRRGLVQFNDTPLRQAVAELNRYATEPLVIHDQAVAELHISGVFRTGDPTGFARIISDLLPVEVVQADTGERQLIMARDRR